MTSHELRNPLSAVIQCAESVINTLADFNDRFSNAAAGAITLTDIQDDVDSSIDAVQTIVSCSLHQKRIIDDVLTLSKLDSNLILITPVRVQPLVVLAGALKMFEVECQQMGIKLDLIEDDTFEGFEWVMLDPSRLLQVLINLLYVVHKTCDDLLTCSGRTLSNSQRIGRSGGSRSRLEVRGHGRPRCGSQLPSPLLTDLCPVTYLTGLNGVVVKKDTCGSK